MAEVNFRALAFFSECWRIGDEVEAKIMSVAKGG
jgi:hypothetical protein